MTKALILTSAGKCRTDLLVSYFCVRQIRQASPHRRKILTNYTPLNAKLSGIGVALTVASRCEKTATLSAVVKTLLLVLLSRALKDLLWTESNSETWPKRARGCKIGRNLRAARLVELVADGIKSPVEPRRWTIQIQSLSSAWKTLIRGANRSLTV